MKKFFSVFLFLFVWQVYGQEDTVELSFESVEIDTSTVNVFEQAPNAKFKLDYYHTDGYSTNNRYWYEILIIDSLLILNFHSPANDDWNYINYQKQIVLEEDIVVEIKQAIETLGIQQKVKGIPLPPGTGYGADRLYIESPEMKIAGGTVYITIGAETSVEQYNQRIALEKEISTTLGGDFQKLFNKLEEVFTDLPMLIESKNREY